MPVGAATRENLLASLLLIAERSLTVAQLATTDLWCPDESLPVEQVAAEMKTLGFDVAPVGEPPLRCVALEDLLHAGGIVKEVAIPIDITLLVTWDLALVDGIRLLASRPYYFVLESNRIRGLVTRSDLQRPAVSMVLFSLILATELALRSMIATAYGNDDWKLLLSSARQEKLEEVYASRSENNTQMTRLDCLMLEDTLTLVRKHEEIRQRLGLPSGNQFKDWEERQKHLRNSLAHGSGLLDIWPNPTEAVSGFTAVHEFTKRVWLESAVGPESSGR